MTNFLSVYFTHSLVHGSNLITVLLLVYFVPADIYLKLVQVLAFSHIILLILGSGIENSILKEFSKRNNKIARKTVYALSFVLFLAASMTLLTLATLFSEQQWMMVGAACLYAYAQHLINSYTAYLNAYKRYSRYRNISIRINFFKLIALSLSLLCKKLLPGIDFSLLYLLLLSVSILLNLKISFTLISWRKIWELIKSQRSLIGAFALISFGDLTIIHADKFLLPKYVDVMDVGNFLKVIQLLLLPVSLLNNTVLTIFTPLIYGQNMSGTTYIIKWLGLNRLQFMTPYLVVSTLIIIPFGAASMQSSMLMYVFIFITLVITSVFTLLYNLIATKLISRGNILTLLYSKIFIMICNLSISLLTIQSLGLLTFVVSNFITMMIVTIFHLKFQKEVM